MNKDINNTLYALIPILRMNGEKVMSIEAVHDWYKGQYKDSDGKHREYMKEVAEIVYENGYRMYADIGGDSNLTACYDILAVIQQLKPKSAVIERIERCVYSTADVVPVRKGKWILVKGSNGKDYHKCSYCLHTQEITGVKNYCSVCGARMEGAES